MYIEMVDETGQVSDEIIKTNARNFGICCSKDWERRQGNGCDFCNQRAQS